MGKAQFIQPCIDESRVQPFYQCNDPIIEPICGCNGTTYRNQCEAFNVYGVNNWISGVCNGVFLYVSPNPVGPNSPLNIYMSHGENIFGNFDLKIIDLYGKVWQQRIINNINAINIQIEVSTLKSGIYVLYLTSSTKVVQVKKIIKY